MSNKQSTTTTNNISKLHAWIKWITYQKRDKEDTTMVEKFRSNLVVFPSFQASLMLQWYYWGSKGNVHVLEELMFEHVYVLDEMMFRKQWRRWRWKSSKIFFLKTVRFRGRMTMKLALTNETLKFNYEKYMKKRVPLCRTIKSRE